MKKKVDKDVKVMLIIFLIIVAISGISNLNEYMTIRDLSYVRETSHLEMVSLEQFNEFIENKEVTGLNYNIDKDYITGVLYEEAKIKHEITSSGFVCLGNITDLIEDGLITNKVIIEAVEKGESYYLQTPFQSFTLTIFVSIVLFFMYLLLKRYTMIGNSNYTDSSPVITNDGSLGKEGKKEGLYKTEQVIKMDDVKGHDEIRADLEFLIKVLKNPERYEKVGAKVPKGVMLFGPPGTGKTMIAKAIASEVGIPFIATGGSDFIEKYVGVGAKRIRDIFSQAKQYDKAIIYIDEIDAVGRKRTDSDNDERAATLNALLMEMDGFKDSQNILVIASTNRLDILDDALLRPGRFDRHIAVNPPDYKGRLDILNLYAKNKRLDKDVKLEKVAQITRGFSGAELANLLNEAAMLTAFRDKDKTTMQEIDDAFYKIVTKGDKKSSFDRSVEDTILTAWHEAGHTIVSKLLANQKVNKVTIIPSTSGAGGITLMEPKEGSYYSQIDLENMVKVSYGGRAAEYLLLRDEKKVTTGASNDIEKATNIIMSMLSSYGMCEKFGLLNLEKMRGLNQEYLLTEAKEISNKLYKETVNFLEENYELLKKMSEVLVQKETLDEEEIEFLINNHVGLDIESNIIIPDFAENTDEEKKKNVLKKLIPDKLIPDMFKSDNAKSEEK